MAAMELIDRAKDFTIFGLQQVRPWVEFYDFGKFEQPPDEAVQRRVRTNFKYYRANYGLMCLMMYFFALFFSRNLLSVSVLLIFAWALHFFKPVTRGPVAQLSAQSQRIILVVISFFFVLCFCGTVVFGMLGLMAALVGLHALFRKEPTDDGGCTFSADDRSEPEAVKAMV